MARTLLGALGAALLCHCAASVSPPDAGVDAGVSLSAVELCDRLASARCDLLDRCYPAFQRQKSADCRSLEQARCFAELETLRPLFDDKSVEIDSAKALLCEERMSSSRCPPTFPPGYAAAAAPFSDCQLSTELLRGLLPSGQACEHPAQCTPGTLCLKTGDVCRGTCASYSLLGEPCGVGCTPGTYCADQSNKDPSDDRCESLRALNEPCETSAQCLPQLHCSAGLCRPRNKEAEACVFDLQRLSTCEPGLACDVAPFVRGEVGTCVKPRSIGQSCRFHWSCEPGLVCFDMDYAGFPLGAPAPGVCQVPAPEGVNCPATIYATYVGDQCTAGTYCATGDQKCTATPSLGEPCTPSSQSCTGLDVFCKPMASGDVGTCTGPVGLGERCAFVIDATRTVKVPCASGYCATETTSTCQAPNKQLGQLCETDGECLSDRCTVQQDRTLRCASACP